MKTLRQVRERADRTQEEVVQKLGSYASFVSKIEAGERRVDVVELAARFQVYGITRIDFLKEAGLCD